MVDSMTNGLTLDVLDSILNIFSYNYYNVPYNVCFAATLSTCFYWVEGALAEAVVAAVSFCSPFEQIVEKMNFLV
jgi:hypothetical protein